MEKLIELLNEFDKKKLILSGIEFGLWSIKEDAGEWLLKYKNYESNASVSYAISKSYGFIERLVENDYINMNKVERDATSYFTDESPVYGDKIWNTRLIMMLSVSNSPIKDLIYYLGKEDEHPYIRPGGCKFVFNAKKSYVVPL